MRRSDAVSNRERILQAASRLLVGETTGQVRLEEIASAAGVGAATLYRHFPNRDLLVHAVFGDLLERRITPVLAAARTADPITGLRAVAGEIVQLAYEEPGLTRLVGNFVDEAAEVLERVAQPLADLLARAQTAGQVRDDLTAADVPRILALALAVLSLTDLPEPVAQRYLVMAFDGLKPANASPLQPLPATEGDTLRAVLSRSPR